MQYQKHQLLMEKPAYFFILVTILSLSSATICSHFNKTTDQESLIAFKSSIISDPYETLTKNWSSNASICGWIGVSCSLNHQRVTALNFSGFRFKGTIPPAIGNLTFLTSLDLSYNNFTGFIPKELSNLSRLQVLNFIFNSLTGEIPHGFFNLSSIEEVQLTANNLQGGLPKDMCNGISRLSVLSVSMNLLSGQIPFDIYKCSELTVLSLSANHFSGSLPSSIGRLKKLQRLYVGVNSFQGGVPSSLHNLSRLRVLSMPGLSLTGQIPSFIFNMSSLEVIQFANNSLSGSLPLYHNLPNLERLYLESNMLTGKPLDKIQEFKRLQVISLSENKFTGEIPKSFGNLTMLKYLYLSDNSFTGELPSELGNLDLVDIDVSYNGLSSPLPFSIFNISTIKMLSLSANSFSEQLPSTFGLSLPNLQGLDLGDNELYGVIPSSINNASSLTILSMGPNNFTGSVPNLGNLKLLKNLYLSSNDLTGEYPNKELGFLSSLTSCRNLPYIDLAFNQLNGLLPPSIGNFSYSLQAFHVEASGIRGSIPVEIGNLTNLWGLRLDKNELTGFIPRTMGMMKGLTRISLDYNKLQGHIPGDLCLLNRLAELYLSHNKLQGPIPECFSELKSIQELYLDSNKLESVVPSDLWNLNDLIWLNLSMNNLSGSFPTGIEKLKVISKLDLSFNSLLGDVPSDIDKAVSLDYLSLAHNEFQGSIPPSIGNLKSLEFLDLSFNSFSGFIPKSLEGLTYLRLFNVSYNKLEGKIPTGGIFVNFTTESFLKNDGLCGETRLRVRHCRKGVNFVSLMKYIVPSCVSVLVVVTKQLPNDEISLLNPWKGSSYMELVRATNDFSESNKLGNGGTSTVFMGMLSDGLIVAIKVFNPQSEKISKSFDTEVGVLRAIRHRNLIKVIGCCCNQDFKALVMEYMPNGSLEKWLHSHNHFLDLLQRLNIAIDVALALEYLRLGHTFPIVHCDLKPSNVLLDEDMIAHVGDFGIAKLLGEGELMAHTKTLATIGYMAPEYGAHGIVSTSGDIYSFGIMLLEMYTGKKPTDERFGDEITLKSWVSFLLQENRTSEVVDTNLLGSEGQNFSAKEQCLSSMLCLAMECLATSPSDRISISDVVSKLQKIRSIFLANNTIVR
ncbi:Serine/threonine protein kinase [Handroanthus impetiginosus]|uniref:non-specific serine/threonine protein kinase n=1 Tax=Handroanthus impetiginosus TaxID=429701 RepID=A0A2G9I154_9LAMI|nr:Serine/threonine protein kinase [Handroanthus impetiginosus]